MKICIVQSKSVKGDIQANIKNHLKFLKKAAEHGANAIFFPELSITGYEPDLADKLKTTHSDSRFHVFQDWSNQYSVIIGIGVPTVSDDGICISMVVFQPHQRPCIYSKQFLHEDEEPYFVHGKDDFMMSYEGENIAPAICYESLLPQHSEKAFSKGAHIYMACVAKPNGGVQKAFSHFPVVAKRYSMSVLMANCVGYCDNFESAGSSAVWNRKGELLARLDHSREGLIVFNTENDETLINYLP